MTIMKKILATIIALTLTSAPVYAKEAKKSDEYSYLDKMFGYAAELYIDETLTKEEILDRALDKYLEENPDAVIELLKAGFSQIDDYTEFYTQKDFEEYYENINHVFYGIGVIIQKEGDYVKIMRVLDDGAAKAVGIAEGDLISGVDGESMKGKSIDDVQEAIVGELGTMVSVTVLRNGEEYTYNLERSAVNSSTVSYVMLNDEICYISIINFAMNTAEEFSDVLAEIDKKNVTKIILDLRNNPGGYLMSAVQIGEMIVPKGIIVQTMFRQSENNFTYYSNLENPKYEFAVLVNENTASAAEILTGAIQDSGVGKVFGETTYGKAVIQDMYNMRDSNAFKITTGRYLTRNGREINKKGLDPDYEVINTTEPVDVSKYKTIDYHKTSRFGDVTENIIPIKERLRVLGYHITSVDSNFDLELEAAVLDFQIKKGFPATGALDTVTMVQIENAFAKSEVYVDNQLYKSFEYFGGTQEELDKILN